MLRIRRRLSGNIGSGSDNVDQDPRLKIFNLFFLAKWEKQLIFHNFSIHTDSHSSSWIGSDSKDIQSIHWLLSNIEKKWLYLIRIWDSVFLDMSWVSCGLIGKLSACLAFILSVCLFLCYSVYLSVYSRILGTASLYLSIFLPVCLFLSLIFALLHKTF